MLCYSFFRYKFVPLLYLKTFCRIFCTSKRFFLAQCGTHRHTLAHIDTYRHKMSSKIRVQRICQHCNREFTAQTTVTKYCSLKCAQRAYKARKKAEKIKRSNVETLQTKIRPIEQLKAKEFLSINEVCQLVGISRRTVYRLIEQGDLKKIKIGSRTIIKRTTLNRLLDNKETGKPEIAKPEIKDLKDWGQAEKGINVKTA